MSCALFGTRLEMAGPGGELLQALQLACSQNPEELKVGEEKLSAWKKEKGFYRELAVSSPNLSEISLNHDGLHMWLHACMYRLYSATEVWRLE